MALAEEYSLNAVTIGSTEISIISGTSTLQADTTKGIRGLYLDAFNMAKGDEFVVRIYEKVLSGGTKRLALEQTLSDAQSEMIVFPDLMLFNGWDMTLQKKSGTDRAFTASIRATTGTGLTEAYTQSALSTSASETSLISGTTTLQSDTTPGKVQVWLDLSNLTHVDGDSLIIRAYEKAVSGGTKVKLLQAYQVGRQYELYCSPVLTLLHGWDITIQRESGSTKSINASIRMVG